MAARGKMTSNSMKHADRITSGLLAALGIAMLVGGYRMDRLEIRQIHPSTIPGLVPMILGVLMVICATLLFVSARKANTEQGFLQGGDNRYLLLTLGLTLVYALGLVGNLPFAVATAIFITAFSLVFTWPLRGLAKAKLKATASAAAIGVISAFLISLIFEQGFLVRLP
ncbi:tripartite tricarboxylate transporter TctB family protein [Qingshengfaniella alkalisoli]|uniref:DUF1468 domain-containing protein n=1 Tax=Qingshengfaniella alkalisoli TaxID=2599296 RepID=A0A5B8J4A7_9RHOB|nr:tripartite tricarboxylate transporter TctB family protein [Qingshengfaniella alkalisoli]QDY71538.1 hypothetical protein FPZ52_17845 [Qingshengfaniella alkalisoli]